MLVGGAVGVTVLCNTYNMAHHIPSIVGQQRQLHAIRDNASLRPVQLFAKHQALKIG